MDKQEAGFGTQFFPADDTLEIFNNFVFFFSESKKKEGKECMKECLFSRVCNWNVQHKGQVKYH